MFSLLQCLCDTDTLIDICKYASLDGTRRTCQDLKKVLVNHKRRPKRNPSTTNFIGLADKKVCGQVCWPKGGGGYVGER